MMNQMASMVGPLIVPMGRGMVPGSMERGMGIAQRSRSR